MQDKDSKLKLLTCSHALSSVSVIHLKDSHKYHGSAHEINETFNPFQCSRVELLSESVCVCLVLNFLYSLNSFSVLHS